ncbi:hypothetical protein [Actinomycetospora termitidis]|uniref:Uncharacterized protein n=1 Tax=Actinomycetospora termitidis TaxID=3053470 RepID=A0ABT7MFM7_9PSEU|nr:hypothetical protein [Actinomycetospora sp. Odt1-22]MDL5159474.1 hypothetical protein [Actinomycetospora sp. Odt1-22]
MSAPALAPEVLVEKLVALGSPERGARLLVQADPDTALDVVNGDVCSPRTGPPVGPDGEVYVDYREQHAEHDPTCWDCGGAGGVDGLCRCATWVCS